MRNPYHGTRTVAAVVLLVGCLATTAVLAVVFRRVEPPPPAPASVLPTADAPVLVGAGDIASCLSSGDERTAALLDHIPGTVFTLGDNVYESGTALQFRDCYEPSWGRHRYRTRPALGNHDYGTKDAAPYFAYFGAAEGNLKTGYYSYEKSGWHVVVLNTNCGDVGGCGEGSPQVAWLKQDLVDHPDRCTVAMEHHPRFSTGPHGDDPKLDTLWRTLVGGGVDLVLAGHDHDYERDQPLDANGNPDPNGTREFVVGTGGRSLYAFARTDARVAVRSNGAYGVLRLDLRADGYDWIFVPVDGETLTDSGSGTCR